MDEAAGHVQHPWCSRHRSLEGDMAVTFYGDPHGSFGPLLAEWEKRRPNHVVLLGDMDLERPLKDELEPLFRAGTTVWWILGNHDGDREAWYRNLVESHPDGDLGGRVHVLDGIRVAGLGGVYRGSGWEGHTAELKSLIRTATGVCC